jgi:CheY-like chemotaxis protein
MDLSLPQMDGWETARRLREDARTAGIPILALTGHVLADFSKRRGSPVSRASLTKPCLPEDLVAEIHRVLTPGRRPPSSVLPFTSGGVFQRPAEDC